MHYRRTDRARAGEESKEKVSTKEHVTAIRTKLAETKAPATVNATLSALRGVAREAWRLGLMTSEDRMRIEAVKGIKGSRLPAGRALSVGEVIALFDVCARDASPAGARDAAMLALLLGAGLRRAECAEGRRWIEIKIITALARNVG